MLHLRIPRKQVKGGILLYALVLALIFSLLLQFYLNAQVATYKTLKTEEDYQTAQLMVTLAKEKLADKAGIVSFDNGTVTVSADGTRVQLTDGADFTF